MIIAAVLSESHTDRARRPNIACAHHLYSPIRFGDDLYRAKLVAMERLDGRHFYGGRLTEMKRTGPLKREVETDASEPGPQGSAAAPKGADIDVGEFLAGVKYEDGSPVMPQHGEFALEERPGGSRGGRAQGPNGSPLQGAASEKNPSGSRGGHDKPLGDSPRRDRTSREAGRNISAARPEGKSLYQEYQVESTNLDRKLLPDAWWRQERIVGTAVRLPVQPRCGSAT